MSHSLQLSSEACYAEAQAGIGAAPVVALEELGVPILGQHLLEELLLERAVGDLGPLELAFVELLVGMEGRFLSIAPGR